MTTGNPPVVGSSLTAPVAGTVANRSSSPISIHSSGSEVALSRYSELSLQLAKLIHIDEKHAAQLTLDQFIFVTDGNFGEISREVINGVYLGCRRLSTAGNDSLRMSYG